MPEDIPRDPPKSPDEIQALLDEAELPQRRAEKDLAKYGKDKIVDQLIAESTPPLEQVESELKEPISAPPPSSPRTSFEPRRGQFND